MIASDLKGLFIAANVVIQPLDGEKQSHAADIQLAQDDTTAPITARIHVHVDRSPQHRCARCFQWTAPEPDQLCMRCADVVENFA